MRKFIVLFLMTSFLSCIQNKEESKVITIKNDYLKISAKKNGAELISIKLLEDNTEYLWQGDSITWSDHAIVQFPIIGNVKNDEYQYDNTVYEMMSHGFARVSQFKLLEKTSKKMVFLLKSNSNTKTIYPFDFTLKVTYQLENKSIKVLFEVVNQDDKNMFFSLGYHPGFNCPLKVSEKMEDYFLEFSNLETSDRLLMENNLIDSVQKNYLHETKRISLSKSIFQNDAIILNNIGSNCLSLKNDINNRSVTVNFGNIDYLGIWSPKKFGDFVCIEPWFGVPDFKNTSGKLEGKEGILKLPKSKDFKWECLITIN